MTRSVETLLPVCVALTLRFPASIIGQEVEEVNKFDEIVIPAETLQSESHSLLGKFDACISAGKGYGILGGIGMNTGCGGFIYGWRQKRLYLMKQHR
ncbi:MAG: hypothetical protein WBB23_23490 [Desulforhopalus sp.]